MVDQDQKTRRKLIKLSGSIGFASIAGCSGESNNQPSSGTTPVVKSNNTYSTKLAMPYYPLITSIIPFIAGIKKGIYKKHNVNIESVTSFSGGGTTVRGIVTGGIGMGATALPALVKGYLAGAPIYLTGLAVCQTNINFMVKPDSDIEKVQDFKNKTIGVGNVGSSSEATAIETINNADGISLDDVKLQRFGGLAERVTAFNEGLISVVTSTPPFSTRMVEKDRARIAAWGYDYTAMTEMVLAVGGTVRREQPELAKNLTHAQVDCMKWTRNNPGEAAKLWSENSNISLSIAKKCLERLDVTQEFRTISPEKKILTATAEAMIHQGLIDEQPPWEKIVWQDPLPDDKQLNWLK